MDKRRFERWPAMSYAGFYDCILRGAGAANIMTERLEDVCSEN